MTYTLERATMEIVVARRKKKSGEGTYLVLMARAEWGTKFLTFDEGVILQIIPSRINHRTLDEKGVVIGKIAE